MKITVGACRVMARRLMKIVAAAAAGTGLVSLASGGQVFASQFLKEAAQPESPAMVYSPELQVMVDPGTADPIFSYSQELPRGKANGEYQVAPLVTTIKKPKPQPTHTVAPGPVADND